MKTGYLGIIMIVLVTVALALSGCSGSNPTATPTPAPQSGGPATGTPTPVATPGPTAAPGGGGMSLGDLYKNGQFSWIEYRQIMSSGGQNMTVKMKMEMLGQAMHEGKMMNHIRIITSFGSQDIWSDPDAPASADTTDFANSKAALTRLGPDAVTIDGKTYACTKYTAPLKANNMEVLYTFWYSPEAPAPVQYVYSSAGETVVTQLTGWG